MGHAILAGGLQVGENGHLFADAAEIVERKLDVGGMSHGEKVKHGVGRTAEGDDDRDGVFKRLFRHDVAGTDAGLEQSQRGFTGAAAIVLFLRPDGELGRTVGQAHAERLDGRGHGVGSIHAAARAGAGDGAGFDGLEAGIVEFVRRVLTDRFKDGNDVALLL